MKIGTPEPIKEEEKKLKLKKHPDGSRLVSLGNDDGDGDGNGGNSGNDIPKNKESDIDSPEPTDKSRITMIFLLSIVVMTFGGLVAAYVVIATNNPLEWNPLATLPIQVWISTAFILASSVTYQIARSHLLKVQSDKARTWFLITAGLGGLFISSQLIVWLGLYNRDLYMRGNPYVGFFYIMTAVHVVHVLGGIFSLGYILLRSWNKANSNREIEKRKNDATAIGWYWHTMDVLWLVLLFLLGFFK